MFDSQAVYAANVESLDEEIEFKMIFKTTGNITYVSVTIDRSIKENSVLKCNFQIFSVFLPNQEYVGNDGDFFVFLNNRAAPKHQLVEIDMTDKKPGRHFDVIVPVSVNV